MQAKGLAMLRVLLNRFHQKATEATLRCLPPEDAKGVFQQQIPSNNPALALTQPEELIAKMHYSWLLPGLEALPKPMQTPLLSALPKMASEKLQALLGYNSTPTPQPALAPPVQIFLLHKLYALIEKSTPLPLDFLPQTPLAPLVALDKAQLVEVVDLLGIYDLTEEVRQIINKDRLKKIYACLGQKQRQFLRVCLHQKEKISASPLGLEQWQGDPKEFARLLHNRGLIRLGRALCGQHPDFIWYLTHTLDKGRGNLLKTYYEPSMIPHITPILLQQVISLLNFLSPKSTREQ